MLEPKEHTFVCNISTFKVLHKHLRTWFTVTKMAVWSVAQAMNKEWAVCTPKIACCWEHCSDNTSICHLNNPNSHNFGATSLQNNFFCPL